MSGGQATERAWRHDGNRALAGGRSAKAAVTGGAPRDGRRIETTPRAHDVRRARLGALVGLSLVGLALVVAGCAGAGSSVSGPRGADLTAQVDYAAQVTVGTTDQVTLTLTPRAHANGAASGAAAGTITLPSDPATYTDIGVSADAVGNGGSALAWELITPYRQSVLGAATGGAREYVPVTFRWRVTALGTGRSTQRIVLGVYYTYRDGSEHDGTVDLTAAPVPIRGVGATVLNSDLPPLRWPMVGVALLLAALAFLRFGWGMVRALADSGRRRQGGEWGAMAGVPRGKIGPGRGREARLPAPGARQLLARPHEDEW